MCGLVGVYSSNMIMKHKACLMDLLYLDTWRGKDSTGIAAIRANADTEIIKSTVPGYEFVENRQVENFLKYNDFCWIGHNRYGTVGKNIKANAHPFQVLDEDGACILVGANNGTLKNKEVLTDHLAYGTDSEALYNEIALTSIEEAIAKVEGAWALTYYDHLAEELRFLRNKERPLFYAFDDKRTTMFWASEQWMIRIATSRNDIKLLKDEIYQVEEDCLYKFPAPMKINEELTFVKQGGLAGKQPGFFLGERLQRWTGGQHGYPTANRTQQETKEATPKASQTPTMTSQSGMEPPKPGELLPKKNEDTSRNQLRKKLVVGVSNNIVSIDSGKTFKGYRGEVLSRTELDEQLAGGCGWCELEFISPKDAYGWLAPHKPVCGKCLTGTPHVSIKRNVLNLH